MLYTIVPFDIVMGVSYEPPLYRTGKDGVIVEWRKGAYGEEMASRIITTDLKHYLSPQYRALK